MNEAFKHATGTATTGAGFFGWITLHGANELAGLCCALIGCVAGLLTIRSLLRKK